MSAGQQSLEAPGSGECSRRNTQPHELSLRVRYLGCNIAVEYERATRQRIWKVDGIDTELMVTPIQTRDVALSKSFSQAGHGWFACSSLVYIHEHGHDTFNFRLPR